MITIRHTDAEGTVIEGSVKGDGVWEIVKNLRWRSRPVPGIHIQASRFKPPQTGRIQAAAKALRDAGHEVTVDIDAERLPFAEAEELRRQAADNRAERLGERAQRVGAEANARYERARQMADAIPFGQPMMPDHYSYNRDRRYRDRIHSTYGRAFEGMREAEELTRRANSVTDRAAESPTTTLNRIAKLEAEQRANARAIEGGIRGRRPYQYVERPATGARLESLQARQAAITEEIAYWHGQLEQRGARVYGRADFARGDFALGRFGWCEVLRVNAKTVTIPWITPLIGTTEVFSKAAAERVAADRKFGGVSTDTLPYSEIKGKRTAAEMAAAGQEEPCKSG